ncbi:hypothetical protein M8C21_016544 [Ambrosia artemisiifolia]|uniref:Uncharacterized protein n=1 Tax=Ambrosia artemisiifolia TaxID=4212 RepID=A0AAD5BS57_AMBAR|nr:hypothetical protein M8C21_016544 [Ambrosia artemisiifolia]
MVKVTCSQLCEIAMALEACDVNFIWVVRNDQETLIPEGFEARMEAKGKGLIIKGWAPQVLILDHESVGGFLTHCGWNSLLEGVSSGVWSATSTCDGVKREVIETAIARVMDVEDGEDMRMRARELKEKAHTAIEGGSSYSDLTTFIEDMNAFRPFEHFTESSQPNCIVADMFFPWTIETAENFNIPRIAFNGTGIFPLCVADAIRLNNPTVSSNSEPFVVPNLPHEIKITRKQLPQIGSEEFKVSLKVIIQGVEAEARSYGVIVNSFYEFELEYAHHFHEVLKRKAWHITEDKLERGKKSLIDEYECLKWLESKPPNSVIYIITCLRLCEIAMALEACDVNFICVIRNDQEMLIPEGFEARIEAKGKGLIIKGWVPQVLILDHESVGGFFTHCEWNSLLKGVSSGVAMVAWSVMAKKFYNAKLVTNVLQIGVSIGDVEWSAASTCDGVKQEEIERAVARVMDVEDGEDMRMRARELKEKAHTALEEGGSSYSDLTTFIEDINAFRV